MQLPHSKLSLAAATAFLLTVWLALQAPYSHASSKSKTEKRQSSRVKIENTRSGSQETTAERDRRLYRECQGRPNAGACAGYTRR